MLITVSISASHLELHGLPRETLRRELGPVVPAVEELGNRYGLLVRMDQALPEALLAAGRDLYRWLDGTDGWLARVLSIGGPDLELEIRGPVRPDRGGWAVLNAPWELLADGRGFLAADRTLGFAPVRRLGEPRTGPAPDDYRLGVAFMASAPRGEKELDFEAEEQAILDAIDAPVGIDILVEDSGDPEQLKYRLKELQAIPVLHLSCHGHSAWRSSDGPKASCQPVLMMEDRSGNARPTTAASLREELAPYRPRLLFLSACQSTKADGAEPASEADGGVAHSLASTLVGSGVPAVLGWDGSVADITATQFTRELYKQLGKGQELAVAVAIARRSLLAGEVASGPAKDVAADWTRQMMSEPGTIRRGWHLARLWLGPEGGGPLVVGRKKRSLLPADFAYQKLLKAKDPESAVAAPGMFVGRRRDLQTVLRHLAENRQAGVLLHGQGRLGKSSLAMRVAERRRDLTLAVTFKHYDAMSVVDDLADALSDHPPARELLAAAKARIGAAGTSEQARLLEDALIDLLAGPCSQGPEGRPVLLLVDDLERILVPGAPGERRRVCDDERAVLAALLRSFEPYRSDSRLLVTSRFPFTLVENGEELAGRLAGCQLGPLGEPARRKLSRRQIEAARKESKERRALGEAELAARLELVVRARELASGSPGLQDLLGNKVALGPAVKIAHAKIVLAEMQAWIEGGDLPGDTETRTFLQSIDVDGLIERAGASGLALLRAATVFELPVPQAVLCRLADDVGGSVEELVELGLLDSQEDLIDNTVRALAVNALVRSRLPPLTSEERAALATAVAATLSDAWGQED